MKFAKDFRGLSLNNGDFVIKASDKAHSKANGFNYGIIINDKLYYFRCDVNDLLRYDLCSMQVSTSSQLDGTQVLKIENLTEEELVIKKGLLKSLANDTRDKVPFISNFALDVQTAKSLL